MRIVYIITTFIAVLAAVLPPRCKADVDSNSYSVRRFTRSLPPHSSNQIQEGNMSSKRNSLWTTKDIQAVFKRERSEFNRTFVDCCPSVQHIDAPEGGKNMNDLYVELYKTDEIRQTFFQHTCRSDVVDRPCLFIDRNMHNQSKCVQKYSYTYALVRDNGNTQKHNTTLSIGAGWMLDYIEIRSGCACEMSLPSRKRNRHKEKRKSLNPHRHNHNQHQQHHPA